MRPPTSLPQLLTNHSSGALRYGRVSAPVQGWLPAAQELKKFGILLSRTRGLRLLLIEALHAPSLLNNNRNLFCGYTRSPRLQKYSFFPPLSYSKIFFETFRHEKSRLNSDSCVFSLEFGFWTWLDVLVRRAVCSMRLLGIVALKSFVYTKVEFSPLFYKPPPRTK